MKNGMKRALVTGIAACMALTSLAGCSKKEAKAFDGSAVIMTVDGQEVPAGLVKFSTHFAQAVSENIYSMYYGAGAFNMALDAEGNTLGTLVRDTCVEEMKQVILAEQHAEEYGVALTEEEKAAITEAAAAFMSSNEEEVLTKMGASQEVVERYLELYTIKDKVEELMSADVDTEVSDEEAAQRKIEYVYFTALSEKSLEEAETEAEDDAVYMEKAKAKAEEVIAKVKAGEEFAAAVEAVEEGRTVAEISIGADDDATYDVILAATEGLKAGDLVEESIETEYGYYAVQMVEELDREATDERKAEIVNERRAQLVNDTYTEWTEAVEIIVEEDLVSEIVFDFSLTQATEAQTETAETETEAATEA